MAVLGKKIAAFRKERGMKQKELADKLHISVSTLSKWENGQNEPSAEMLKSLASVFQIPVGQLLSDDDTLPDPNPENDVEKKKNNKPLFLVITILLLVILACIYLISIMQKRYDANVLSFKIIGGQYVEDEYWGHIYDFSIVCTKEPSDLEITDYMIDFRNNVLSQDDKYANLDDEWVRLSFYKSKKDAKTHSNPIVQSYTPNKEFSYE